jgi:hypothetical protein
MVKIPQKNESTSTGQTFPGVVCKNPHCLNGIPLGGNVSGLPADFEITCPRCGQTKTYQKAEIQTLVAHTKH